MGLVSPLAATRLCCALVAFVVSACSGPDGGDVRSLGAAGFDDREQRVGQPTASDLSFLLGGWQQERSGVVTSWEVWTRRERGFEGASWQAVRGVSRQTERTEVELTLDGWVLTSVLFDDFEREYRSEPLPLAAWGEQWVRFTSPTQTRPHTIAYRLFAPGRLETAVVSRATDGSDETVLWRSSAMLD